MDMARTSQFPGSNTLTEWRGSITTDPSPDGLRVLHHCDNRPCREITHLFLGTSADNSADMCAKRRQMHGEGHVRARLTDIKVRSIRSLRTGHTLRELSAMFNISVSVVSNVCNGKAWTHVR